VYEAARQSLTGTIEADSLADMAGRTFALEGEAPVASVSIKTVAARAGVSFQTASKVLNGKGNVSGETRQRILDAASHLGYVPNAVARGLVTRSTQTIGVVASDLSDDVLAQFVVGAEREARRQGHSVIISIVGADSDEQGDGERYLRTLIERRVEGILLAAPELERHPHIGDVLGSTVPVVSIHAVPGARVALVGSDHVETGRLATRHLLTHGHRRVGTITGPRTRRVVHSRLRGYEQALQEAGIPFDDRLVEEGDWHVEGGYAAAARLLDRAPDLTALFVQNDTMAIGVLSLLHQRGRPAPHGCALVSCDDIPAARHTIPPLTTVRIPFDETGATAMRLLLERIAEPSAKPRRMLLAVGLVTRGSCGCAARGDGTRTATTSAAGLDTSTRAR
jgi:LacI family transcriptional regulator